MATLFEHIEWPVRQFLAKLVADPKLREEVTYKRYKSAEHNRTLGHKVIIYDNFTLYGVRMRHTKKSAFVSTGEVEVGDELFVIRGSDAPINMSLKDQLVDAEGNTLAIKWIDNVFNLAMLITIEGGRSVPAV